MCVCDGKNRERVRERERDGVGRRKGILFMLFQV